MAQSPEKEASNTYAEAGEQVVCANKGHIICTVARPILIGELPTPDQFTSWHQPEPRVGQRYSTCRICQGHWFHGGPPLRLHFRDGWR